MLSDFLFEFLNAQMFYAQRGLRLRKMAIIIACIVEDLSSHFAVLSQPLHDVHIDWNFSSYLESVCNPLSLSPQVYYHQSCRLISLIASFFIKFHFSLCHSDIPFFKSVCVDICIHISQKYKLICNVSTQEDVV